MRLGGNSWWDPKESWVGVGGGLLKVFCCNAGDETDGLHVGEQRERRSAGSLPVMLIFK